MSRREPDRRSHPWAVAVSAILLLLTPALARPAELIPSVGLTHAIRGDQDNMQAGLALRTAVFPLVQGEVAAGYHREDAAAGRDATSVWPVTMSLWLTPLGPLYAGGGLGLYNRTVDLGDRKDTDTQLGAHVGAGIRIPLTMAAGLDLSGRYGIVGHTGDRLTHPDHLKADFWTLSAGLAIGF